MKFKLIIDKTKDEEIVAIDDPRLYVDRGGGQGDLRILRVGEPRVRRGHRHREDHDRHDRHRDRRCRFRFHFHHLFIRFGIRCLRTRAIVQTV